MLICPQCEFENPEANKFCQNCGISLTNKTCNECGANIPIEADNCHVCGSSSSTVLWAIISQQKAEDQLVTASVTSSQQADKKLEIENLSEFFSEGKITSKSSLPDRAEQYHLQQRYLIDDADYQPITELSDEDSKIFFVQGKVIDKYPLQKSYLARLQKQQMDLFAELKQNLDNSYLSVTQYWNLVGVPTHALPYLMLEKYAPIIPEIYDAWQQQDRGIVLLPDRSRWQLLTELWSEEKLPLAQILWFIDQMAKLWTPLSQVSCAQSLLIDTNLRIDEDQSFCLQQLYLDQEDNPPSLKDLAKTWQDKLAELTLEVLDIINPLLEKAISGQIDDIEQLRIELHSLNPSDDQTKSFNKINKSDNTVNVPKSQSEFPTHQETETENFFDESDEDMVYSSELDGEATAMIPMKLGNITDASCTHIGSQRDHNEDFFGVQTSINKVENTTDKTISARGIYIVCDGMGGHAAGEVASAMAVEQLQQYFQDHWHDELPDKETIANGILSTNEILFQTNLDNSRSGNARMGTTLVMALVQDTQVAIAHVGDSRIYRITRKQGLEQLTLDHEVGQREINRGVEPDIAYGRPDAYQLTQALGPRDNKCVRPDIQFLEITEDCLLLLCSDGLCDNSLLEKHWQNYLQHLISGGSNLEEGLFNLIEFANHYNGHDNITGILVRIKLKPNF
jgi:protein phosphatase